MANPVDRNQLANTMMMLFRGGAPGGDPYANESSGPFAQSPRIYGRGQGAPAPAAAAPRPTARPKGAGKRKAATGPNNIPIPAGMPYRPIAPTNQMPDPAMATSPSSLLQSPEMNATSPSSLLQSPAAPPPVPPNPLQAAVDAAPGGAGYQAPSHNLGLWGTRPFTGPTSAAQDVSAGFNNNPGLKLGRFVPTPITNPAMQGPSPDAYYRMLMGGSGRGQMGT